MYKIEKTLKDLFLLIKDIQTIEMNKEREELKRIANEILIIAHNLKVQIDNKKGEFKVTTECINCNKKSLPYESELYENQITKCLECGEEFKVRPYKNSRVRITIIK